MWALTIDSATVRAYCPSMIDREYDESSDEEYDDVMEPDNGSYEVDEDFDDWYSDHLDEDEGAYDPFDD